MENHQANEDWEITEFQSDDSFDEGDQDDDNEFEGMLQGVETKTIDVWGDEETDYLLERYDKYIGFVGVGPNKRFPSKKGLYVQIAQDLRNKFNIIRNYKQIECRYKTVSNRKFFRRKAQKEHQRIIEVWGNRETDYILKKYKELIKDVGLTSRFRNKRQMYEFISEEMERDLGIRKTGFQIENRYKTIGKRRIKGKPKEFQYLQSEFLPNLEQIMAHSSATMQACNVKTEYTEDDNDNNAFTFDDSNFNESLSMPSSSANPLAFNRGDEAFDMEFDQSEQMSQLIYTLQENDRKAEERHNQAVEKQGEVLAKMDKMIYLLERLVRK